MWLLFQVSVASNHSMVANVPCTDAIVNEHGDGLMSGAEARHMSLIELFKARVKLDANPVA